MLNLFWLFFVLRIAYTVVIAKVISDVRSDDEGDDNAADETDKGDMSESDLSRQVSAVEAVSAIDKIEPGKEDASSSLHNRFANANGNGHVNGNAGLGLGIDTSNAILDARKGSLKEGSDEDDHEDGTGDGGYVRVEGRKEK